MISIDVCILVCQLDADWAEKLTQMGRGKHHIGDFIPPDELEKFMETYNVSCHIIESCSQPCIVNRLWNAFLLL